MKEVRRLSIHVLLLLVAAVAAFVKGEATEENAGPLKPGEVELWNGSFKDVTRITYETDRQVVTLERKEDDKGLWYLGKVEPVDVKEEPEVADAGADAGVDGGVPPHPKPKPVEPSTFAAVSVAEKIFKALAPLRAARAVGEVSGERDKTFGLDKPEGTLTVELGDKKHVLVVGAPTPAPARATCAMPTPSSCTSSMRSPSAISTAAPRGSASARSTVGSSPSSSAPT